MRREDKETLESKPKRVRKRSKGVGGVQYLLCGEDHEATFPVVIKRKLDDLKPFIEQARELGHCGFSIIRFEGGIAVRQFHSYEGPWPKSRENWRELTHGITAPSAPND